MKYYVYAYLDSKLEENISFDDIGIFNIVVSARCFPFASTIAVVVLYLPIILFYIDY